MYKRQGLYEVLTAICFLSGLILLPFAEVYTLLMTNPLFVTIFAFLFLKEKVGVRRWIAITAGFIGVLMIGFKRAAFSNEAGVGSASIAHSAVKTKYAASEGLVALLEPFIDTVVICTLTALVIITFNSTGVFTYGGQDGGVMIDGIMYEGAGTVSYTHMTLPTKRIV